MIALNGYIDFARNSGIPDAIIEEYRIFLTEKTRLSVKFSGFKEELEQFMVSKGMSDVIPYPTTEQDYQNAKSQLKEDLRVAKSSTIKQIILLTFSNVLSNEVYNQLLNYTDREIINIFFQAAKRHLSGWVRELANKIDDNIFN